MTREELKNRYFEWMYQLVCNDRYSKKTSYRNLLYYLYNRQFDFTIAMDGNRAADGEDLRYRFGYECKYSDSMVCRYLDDRPCSILEMMVALALRIEEHIMADDDLGDRTGQWFWNMIVSLGLGGMTDSKFDVDYVEEVIDRFLDRDYDKNGHGGLFTVENTHKDMRSIEIWYQMCMYLEEEYDA